VGQQRRFEAASGMSAVALIAPVDAATEVEVKERKDRVDDAMHATRAAVEEGILPGGGVALLRAAEVLKKLRTHNDDRKTGVEIVRKALSAPARQIACNAGEDGSVILGKVLEKDQYAYGFDAQNGEYVNLVAKGIVDLTKVVRAALQNAASIAGLLITTEAMVAERPKKDSGTPAMPGGGMGGMDY
jgi:chaperonin GroEL